MKIKLTPEFLKKLYIEENKSTIEIAKESGYSTEAVRKKLIQYNIERRDHSDAQKIYLKKSGKHPTKGKMRSEVECKMIQNTMRKNWLFKKIGITREEIVK